MPRVQTPVAASEDAAPIPSARQREVIGWLAAGVELREVARRLNRRPQAVQQRVAAILARLGVATPAEALARLSSETPAAPPATAAEPQDAPADATEPAAPAAA